MGPIDTAGKAIRADAPLDWKRWSAHNPTTDERIMRTFAPIPKEATRQTAPRRARIPDQRRPVTHASGDEHEQEADQVAGQVVLLPAAVSGLTPRIERSAGQSAGDVDPAPASVHQVLRSPGTPLEPTLRHEMDCRFGHDFSRVRVHSGATAAQSARHVSASAYTVGHDIVFGANRFAPATHDGRRLLAHELTHVIQQSRSPRSRILMRSPDTPTGTTAKPPVPKPGHTPFNFISESPALENWKVSVKEILEREFKTKFATFEGAHEHFRQHLRSLPSDSARENFGDRMRDRARKGFYRREARNPSYSYKPEDIARMRNGAAPVGELQLEHMEEVKSKTRGGTRIQGRPERALDPANIYVTEGGPGGTAPVGTKHAEKQRTIEAAKKASQEARQKASTTPGQSERTSRPPQSKSAVTTGSKAVQGESIRTEIPSPAKPAVRPTVTVPEAAPETVALDVKPPRGASMGAMKLVAAEIAVNVLLFAVAYYLNKWHAEKQVRKFNRDLKELLPDVNGRLKSKEAEIVEAERAFPLVYGNITIVYTHDKYAPEDYNEGSMVVQDVTISHQNYQTPERLIKAYDVMSGNDPSYALTFSVPLFEESAAEQGASSFVSHYRQVRENLTHQDYKVRLSTVITVYKMAKQDSSLDTLVVRDLLGMLKDGNALVRLAATACLSKLKAKIAIRYIREVVQITNDSKHKEMIQRYLRELELG